MADSLNTPQLSPLNFDMLEGLSLIPLTADEAEAAISAGAELISTVAEPVRPKASIRSHEKRAEGLMFYIKSISPDGGEKLEGVPLQVVEEAYHSQLAAYPPT